ncbi:methyltransferase domain-containing protein [bacterium]|nr:methyltransferase domain-containing protein [bacterium]
MSDNTGPIRDFFDAQAENWDESTYSLEHRRRIPVLLEQCQIQPGMRCVDVGTGTGIIVPILLNKVSSTGQIIAFDLSERMLRTARQRHDSTQVFFMQCQAEYIALRSESCDLSICFSVFPHFSHHPRALSELYRVTKPGGYLYIIHLEGSESLNRFHAHVDGPVNTHRLPDAAQMARLLNACHWQINHLRDTTAEYFVEAQKSE